MERGERSNRRFLVSRAPKTHSSSCSEGNPADTLTELSLRSGIPSTTSFVSPSEHRHSTTHANPQGSKRSQSMQMASATQTSSGQRVTGFLHSDDTQTPVPFLVLGAGLALAIAIIHLQDQGGLLGDQSPAWLKYGYYMVEISSTISAALILRGKTVGWLLGLASSIGLMTGYILSRTVGVPGDSGDVGNWGYLLGTVSLVVEGTFIVLAVICLIRIRKAWQLDPPMGWRRSHTDVQFSQSN